MLYRVSALRIRPRLALAALATLATSGCDIYNSSLLGGGGTTESGVPDTGAVIRDAGRDGTTPVDARTGHDATMTSDGSPPMDAAPSCTGDACRLPTSCIEGGTGAGLNCVPGKMVNCCSAETVPGGSFDQANEDASATLDTFTLDRFEVTVGRFRRFVNLGLGTQVNPPKSGAGASPHIPGSGWNASWNQFLPEATTNLAYDLTCDGDPSNYNYTWTDSVENNEVLPINCISWFEAFAFCAWDGGRLPTSTEWNYAAAGGSEQRLYPWSVPPSSAEISPAYAVYDCTGHGGPPIMLDGGFLQCELTDIPPVGSKSPLGDGRWGHSDLAGSMYEWALDWWTPYLPYPCDDCAVLDGGHGGSFADASPDASIGRIQRGGGYYDPAGNLYTYDVYLFDPVTLYDSDGIRCARDP